MNARSQEIATISPMSIIERASKALSKEETEIEIKALVERSKPIVEVTDSASRQVAHESLMTLKSMRVLIEKRGKEGREEAVSYSKAIISIEKSLTALIAPEEQRLLKLRDEWDAAREREKEAKIQAEIKRVQDLQWRIDQLRNWPAAAVGKPSAMVNQMLTDASAYEVLEEAFLYQERLAYEAEQAAVQAKLAELAKLKEEEAQRQKAAAEARAKVEAEEKATRDAELKAQREALDADRKRLAAEREEMARRDEETRKAQADETARLVAQREAIEREQAKLAEAQKPKPAKAKVPSAEEIVDVLAKHYGVSADTAQKWLIRFWNARSA